MSPEEARNLSSVRNVVVSTFTEMDVGETSESSRHVAEWSTSFTVPLPSCVIKVKTATAGLSDMR